MLNKKQRNEMLGEALENLLTADDAAPQNIDYARHMVAMSIAQSLLVIANTLAMVEVNSSLLASTLAMLDDTIGGLRDG